MATLHEGVSCDVCLTENFRGLRYKCLTCYDYDLCQRCFSSKMVSSSHKISHPMQCLIAKGDFPQYYGPEPGISPGHHVTFTCPLCGLLGLSQTFLVHHVRTKHAGSSQNVICPMCAGTPGCDPNVWTNDLAAHLANRHATASAPGGGGNGGGGGGSSNGSNNVAKRRSGKSIGRKIAAHSLDHAYGSEIFPGAGSGLFDERGMGVDPDDPIVDLLMQLSTMRSSPFAESGGGGGNGGGSSRDAGSSSGSRSGASLINRAQRNRIYAQFMHQHRQQGLAPIAHMTAAAAAAAGVRLDRDASSSSAAAAAAAAAAVAAASASDQVRAQQKHLKKYFAGGSGLAASGQASSSFLPKPPPGMRYIGHATSGGGGGAGSGTGGVSAVVGGSGDSGTRPDLTPHPNELCPQVLEEFERGGSKMAAAFTSPSSDASESEYDENLRQGVVRSAFVQQLLLSLLALDEDELHGLASTMLSDSAGDVSDVAVSLTARPGVRGEGDGDSGTAKKEKQKVSVKISHHSPIEVGGGSQV